jgi:hypothetical protein
MFEKFLKLIEIFTKVNLTVEYQGLLDLYPHKYGAETLT